MAQLFSLETDKLRSIPTKSLVLSSTWQQLSLTVNVLCEGQYNHKLIRDIDLFLTNDQDPNKIDNSSYLDLSPLYGNNQAQQDSVRLFVDGKLKPDTFADARESIFDYV